MLLLILELDIGLPSLEILGLLNSIALQDSALSELAEGSDAGLQGIQLLIECLQIVLDLGGQYVLGNGAWGVVAHLQDCLSLGQGTTNDWIVHDVEEFLIGNGPDLG